MNYSLKKCNSMGISKTLIEYLNVEIIKEGRFSYISEESLNKILSFKKENPNTRVILQKYTFLKKYGVENPQQSSEIKNKTTETIKSKYGVDNISQNKEIKLKKIKTLQNNYGENVTNPMDVVEIVDSVKTNWANKSEEEKEKIVSKVKNTKLEIYGNENYNNGEKISESLKSRTKEEIESEVIKIKNTKKERYGDENYNNIEKIKKTNVERYGEDNIFKLDDFISAQKEKRNELKKSIMNQNKYLLTDVAKMVNRDYSTLMYEIIPKLKISLYEENITNNKFLITENDLNLIRDYCALTDNNGKSYSEKKIVEFLHNVCSDEIIENSKKIIPPKELDIYIPSKNLAIEFNGLYWHDELHVDENYHLNKTNECRNKNIDLIHVFEDDWILKTDIVKSMIKSRLGIYERKIFARKCNVREIDKTIAESFFNENHIQGFAKNCNVYVGLFYENELVQAISITLKGWHDNNVELTRMVSKLNTQVIGGFSRLMKYFCRTYNISKVVSYIDNSLFNGKGYYSVGFKAVKTNRPNYFYIMNGERFHKSKFRKNNLKNMYENGMLKYWNDSDTEKEIMLKNNIRRIYNCGTIKVVYEL